MCFLFLYVAIRSSLIYCWLIAVIQAGLFSAVVTTFVVQTSQQLQIDFAEISASLLFELVLAQRSSSNESIHGASPFSSFPFDPSVQFSPDRASTWINGLWFTSLTLSLVTALIAVLVKQWLHQYMSISSGTLRDRSLVRQYRYIGLQAWHVPLIIGLLPVLMHVALALFFLGLALFLSPLNLTIALIVGSLSCVTYLSYAATHILPICFHNVHIRLRSLTSVENLASVYFPIFSLLKNNLVPRRLVPMHMDISLKRFDGYIARRPTRLFAISFSSLLEECLRVSPRHLQQSLKLQRA